MCSLPTIASHSVHNIVSVCLFDSSYMRINFVPFKWLEQHSTPSIWAGNNFYFFPFYSYVVHIIFNHKEIKRTTIRQKSHTEKTVARQNIGLSFGVVVMNVRERVMEAAIKKKKEEEYQRCYILVCKRQAFSTKHRNGRLFLYIMCFTYLCQCGNVYTGHVLFYSIFLAISLAHTHTCSAVIVKIRETSLRFTFAYTKHTLCMHNAPILKVFLYLFIFLFTLVVGRI